jgi:hypothetical protein
VGYNTSCFILVVVGLFKFKKDSVETIYGINSVISKLMTFVENAETGQFLFLIVLILSRFRSIFNSNLTFIDVTFFLYSVPCQSNDVIIYFFK